MMCLIDNISGDTHKVKYKESLEINELLIEQLFVSFVSFAIAQSQKNTHNLNV